MRLAAVRAEPDRLRDLIARTEAAEARAALSGADDRRPQGRYDPDDLIDQVTRNAKLVKGVVKQHRRAIEMRVGDAQAAMCRNQVRSPVALRTTERLAKERDNKAPVRLANAGREELAKLRVSDQPAIQAVDGSPEGRTPPDRLVDGLDRCLGNWGLRNCDRGHSCLLVEVGTSTIPARLVPELE